MRSAGKRLRIVLIYTAISIWFVNCNVKPKEKLLLPIYGDRSLDPVTNDSVDHHVLDFKMTDQLGQIVTMDTFKNKIYCANFFFVTCPGICKKMNSELERVAKKFAGNSNVKFISYTVNPEQDSVPVLETYAKEHEAVPYQWYFVTGDKNEIIKQARFSYNLQTDKNLVHSQNITLIDKKGRIRGVYGGTISEDMDRLKKDIDLLLKEEN
jgi:protein SCO1/2